MTKTGFDRMLEEKMKDPDWAAGYERALARITQTQEGPMGQEDRTNELTPGNCPHCGADISAIERREFEEHVETRFAWENGHWQIKTREEQYTSTEMWCTLCETEIQGDTYQYLYDLPVVLEFVN